MRLTSAFTLFTLSTAVASASLPLFGGQEVISGEDSDLSVPGNNPLNFCQATADDILTIDHVNLKPNPPAAGQTLTIEASGIFNETVEEGAYVNLQVKYGLIRLINQKADLCDQIKNVDLECPIEKGKVVLTKDVDLPNEIPPGKYTVLADVYTVDDRKITCLQTQITFSRK